MPVFKRYLIDQKLRNVDVLVEDRTPNSEHFNVFDLERELPQGRTTFQVLGSDALKSNVEIKMEMVSIWITLPPHPRNAIFPHLERMQWVPT